MKPLNLMTLALSHRPVSASILNAQGGYLSASTHPVYASLDHPLFAALKEGYFDFIY
jgi:hypothetical protein